MQISFDIRNIFNDEECTPASTIKKYFTVQTEGSRDVKRSIDFYNLDMILAIGYRAPGPIVIKTLFWLNRLKHHIHRVTLASQNYTRDREDNSGEVEVCMKAEWGITVRQKGGSQAYLPKPL